MRGTEVAANEQDVRAGKDKTRKGPGRRVLGWAGNLLLSIAALGGTMCILLVVLAYAFDITLVMFRTGSMAPTIPAGSVAVVQQVPAAQIEVGDVVTVDREDSQLPVTHRVTSVEPGESADERVITMRGDANDADDPFPYTVTSARSVLFSVPGIAPVIAAFGNPWVLGGIALGAAALVCWAFWPRGDSGRDDSGAEDAQEHAEEAGIGPGTR